MSFWTRLVSFGLWAGKNGDKAKDAANLAKKTPKNETAKAMKLPMPDEPGRFAKTWRVISGAWRTEDMTQPRTTQHKYLLSGSVDKIKEVDDVTPGGTPSKSFEEMIKKQVSEGVDEELDKAIKKVELKLAGVQQQVSELRDQGVRITDAVDGEDLVNTLKKGLKKAKETVKEDVQKAIDKKAYRVKIVEETHGTPTGSVKKLIGSVVLGSTIVAGGATATGLAIDGTRMFFLDKDAMAMPALLTVGDTITDLPFHLTPGGPDTKDHLWNGSWEMGTNAVRKIYNVLNISDEEQQQKSNLADRIRDRQNQLDGKGQEEPPVKAKPKSAPPPKQEAQPQPKPKPAPQPKQATPQPKPEPRGERRSQGTGREERVGGVTFKQQVGTITARPGEDMKDTVGRALAHIFENPQRVGSVNPNFDATVAAVQKELVDLSGVDNRIPSPGAVDGLIGGQNSNTRKSIRAYQKVAGEKQTGSADVHMPDRMKHHYNKMVISGRVYQLTSHFLGSAGHYALKDGMTPAQAMGCAVDELAAMAENAKSAAQYKIVVTKAGARLEKCGVEGQTNEAKAQPFSTHVVQDIAEHVTPGLKF